MKSLFILIKLAIFFRCFLLLDNTICIAKEYKTQTKDVMVEGKLIRSKFLNPNTNKKEHVFILELARPIDVLQDEFDGPDFNVKKLQLVFFSRIISYKQVKDRYLNKYVIIRGSLFRPTTVHHYTNVLMNVDSIKETTNYNTSDPTN